MAQKAFIKSRIKSVDTTKKITRAMELMANVKLQKQMNQLHKNRTYFNTLHETMSRILTSGIDIENSFLTKKNNKKKLVFVFCSDIGLCGGYNSNLIKYFEVNYSKEDELIVVGSSKYKYFKENYNVSNELIYSDEVTYNELKIKADYAINKYKNNDIGEIDVVYTNFVNNVTFNPTSMIVLPCNKEEFTTINNNQELLLEPNANDILNQLIPMYAENFVYAKFLEAKTSEQGARRFAMQNATDNAEELTEELLLAYNQARQAAITQEINEIVGGAEAL